MFFAAVGVSFLQCFVKYTQSDIHTNWPHTLFQCLDYTLPGHRVYQYYDYTQSWQM